MHVTISAASALVVMVAEYNAAEVLDAVEEPLDEIALAIDPAREGEALLAIGARGDVCPSVLTGGGFTDGIAVISIIGQQCSAFRHGLK